MALILDLPAGLTGTAEMVVGEQHTAPRVGSGRIRVQSLGTHLDITHVAATPVGMRVHATAEVTRVEGRTIHFRVRAEDERELIGEGVHERVVVNVERFDKRVQEKAREP
jgi:fluoroacetyl-CoA thioesterase